MNCLPYPEPRRRLPPAKPTVDALVRYDLPHWRISLNVRNLADRVVVAQCDDVSRCYYDERRSILASAGYTW